MGNSMEQHFTKHSTALRKPTTNCSSRITLQPECVTGVSSPYQQQTRIHQAEGSWPPDARAAVHHDGPMRRVQGARLPYFEQEIEEWSWWLWDAKVRPRSIMKVQNLSSFLCLQKQYLGSLLARIHDSEAFKAHFSRLQQCSNQQTIPCPFCYHPLMYLNTASDTAHFYL